MFFRVIISLFVVMCSSAGLAVDFSAADALFQQRDNNLQAVRSAHTMYANLARGASGRDLIYAYEQMSRLRFYEGLSLPTRDERIATALNCVNEIEAIKSVNNVTPVAYYYWKALCLLSWGRYNEEVDSIATIMRTGEMADLIEKGISTDAAYEGGGCYRLGAALYVKLPPINFFGPSQDLDRAARYVDLAMSSAAHESELDPETATGDYFYKVYEAKARLQRAKRDIEGAKATIRTALARIHAGEIPVGREPETKLDEKDLNELLAEIGQ